MMPALSIAFRLHLTANGNVAMSSHLAANPHKWKNTSSPHPLIALRDVGSKGFRLSAFVRWLLQSAFRCGSFRQEGKNQSATSVEAFALLGETLTPAGSRYSSVHVLNAAEYAAYCIASCKVGSTVHAAYCLAFDTECNEQCRMFREIIPNPFLLVNLNPFWLMHAPSLLSCHKGTIPMLAQAVYDNRAFDCLTNLTDALEESGCHDSAILDHCRQVGEHVRGCWVLDLLLGKE